MSNSSGTSEQVISLPKGGGALHGIGEKFSPDLFIRTGNVTVPIALPPGRNGFQPASQCDLYKKSRGRGRVLIAQTASSVVSRMRCFY